MVAVPFIANLRALAGMAIAAASIFGATPALANSSANADVIAPLRAAQAARQQTTPAGDDEFRQLFSSWQSLDSGKAFAAASIDRESVTIPGLFGVTAATAPGAVSIPSRVPVDGVRLTSSFGERWHPVLGGRRQHKGIDLAAPTGTPVYAAADGVVSRADWFSTYGLFISLEHGGQLQTRYGHLSQLSVYAGEKVHKGDLIGYVGSTGRSTGPHLHYEVRVSGEAVNPIPYLQTGVFRDEEVQAADAAPAMGDGDDE